MSSTISIIQFLILFHSEDLSIYYHSYNVCLSRYLCSRCWSRCSYIGLCEHWLWYLPRNHLIDKISLLICNFIKQQLMTTKALESALLHAQDHSQQNTKSLFRAINSPTSVAAALPFASAVSVFSHRLPFRFNLRTSFLVDEGKNIDTVFTGLYDAGAHTQNISLNDAAFNLLAPLTVDKIFPVVWNI